MNSTATNQTEPDRLTFGEFEFDPETLELWQDGERVHLAVQPARVLRLLLQSAGQLVSREDIQSELWPDKVVDFEQSINASVRQLRRALDDDAESSRYIETLPRLGYRFIHPFTPRRSRISRFAVGFVVAALLVVSVVALRPLDPPARRISQQAFEAYQKGVHLSEQADKGAKARGIEFLERSVAIDPEYTEAWSVLAKAWLKFPDLPAKVATSSRYAAEQALASDPDDASALLHLANVRFLYDWDYLQAGDSYRRALNADPNDPDIHQAYASYLYVMDQPNEAAKHLQRVEELDPLSSLLYGDRSWFFMVEGRYAEALQNCDQLAEVVTDESAAAFCPYRIHVETGDFDNATGIAREILARHGATSEWLQRFDAQSGRDAIRVFNEWRLEQMHCDAPNGYKPALNCALIKADLGRYDEALAHLQTAVVQRDLMLPFLAMYPEFRAMHETAEFQEILVSVGVEDSVFLRVATAPANSR